MTPSRSFEKFGHGGWWGCLIPVLSSPWTPFRSPVFHNTVCPQFSLYPLLQPLGSFTTSVMERLSSVTNNTRPPLLLYALSLEVSLARLACKQERYTGPLLTYSSTRGEQRRGGGRYFIYMKPGL